MGVGGACESADPYTTMNFVIQCIEMHRGDGLYQRLVLKSDNEASIKALKDAVEKGISGVEVLLEESKTGDSQSN